MRIDILVSLSIEVKGNLIMELDLLALIDDRGGLVSVILNFIIIIKWVDLFKYHYFIVVFRRYRFVIR